MTDPDVHSTHDRPRARIDRADTLFVEMLRQIQEEGQEKSFIHATILGEELIFSIKAYEGPHLPGLPELYTEIAGRRAMQLRPDSDNHVLSRLEQLGWTLPHHEDVDCPLPFQNWVGVTSRADRVHLTEQLFSLAREVFTVPVTRTIEFELHLVQPSKAV